MDRDGVLIENVPNYIRRWEDVEYFDQAFRASSVCTKVTSRSW